MSTLDERRDAFENKYAHDENIKFKVSVRANKLLGLWAAEKQGLKGDEVENYARSVVNAVFKDSGEDAIVRKVASDLKGIADETEIQAQMEMSLDEARKEILEQ